MAESDWYIRINKQQTHHNMPLRARYGVSVVSIWEKIDRVITAPHSTWNICELAVNKHHIYIYIHEELLSIWHPQVITSVMINQWWILQYNISTEYCGTSYFRPFMTLSKQHSPALSYYALPNILFQYYLQAGIFSEKYVIYMIVIICQTANQANPYLNSSKTRSRVIHI